MCSKERRPGGRTIHKRSGAQFREELGFGEEALGALAAARSALRRDAHQGAPRPPRVCMRTCACVRLAALAPRRPAPAPAPRQQAASAMMPSSAHARTAAALARHLQVACDERVFGALAEHARTPQRLRVRACGCGARCRRPLIDSSQQRIWAGFERLASARRSSRRWRSRAFLTSQVWRCAQRRATWSLYAVPASPVPFARLPKPWPSFQRSLLLV